MKVRFIVILIIGLVQICSFGQSSYPFNDPDLSTEERVNDLLNRFTVFPQAIAISATWNPELVFDVATAISDEARAKWNFFNQGNNKKYLKVVSTPKHFIANIEEENRFGCNAVISERALREYYYPAFKACITEGKAQSIMSAYNAVNGMPVVNFPGPAGRSNHLPERDLQGKQKYDTYMYFEGEPLYPFGYGLSYSTFDYSSMSVKRLGENIRVSMNVENTGKYDGDEVVQLYYRDIKSSVNRPVKQLLGFERTSLLIGESKSIEFEVPISKLMFWDEECNDWHFEKGKFEFMLGASSEDIRLKETVLIK